jgi:plasmid replication initiation protein
MGGQKDASIFICGFLFLKLVMGDKREHQLTLPLEIKGSDMKEYVKQHWNVTFARQKRISVYAKRIMAMVLAQIRDEELQLKSYYQIHISHIVTESGILSNDSYRHLKTAMDQLTDLKWNFEDLATERFVPRHLLDTTKTLAKNGFECGYNKGWVTVVLNPALEAYFLQLAHYSIYELKHYMTFKSWYSMRVFELLAAFKDTGVWKVSIQEFRELMDCKEKYPKVADLLNRTLTEPLEELKSTKYEFTYVTLQDEAKIGTGRKPIIGLQFNLVKVEPQSIPKEWMEFTDELKKVLLSLKSFKVTEKNIAKYAKIIGLQEAKKLLKEWSNKEKSDRKIDNKEKYCNAVWVRIGKAKEKEGIIS